MIYTLKNRNFWIKVFGDGLLLASSYFLAYYLRFDGNIPQAELANFAHTVQWIVPLKLLCFYFFGLYSAIWRYTSIQDLKRLIGACVTSSVLVVLILLFTVHFVGLSRSVFVIDLSLTFLFLGGFRIGARLYYCPIGTNGKISFLKKRPDHLKEVLIIGAGTAGEMLQREINGNANLQYDVKGFIDDDPYKLKKNIHGVPVLGRVKDIGKIVETIKIDELIIAIPSASSREMRHIVEVCKGTGIPYKTVPGIGEIIDGKVSVSAIREVRYEDLIYREQARLRMEQIGEYLTGKVVMVPGCVGSIGSELARQIALFRPKILVMVDKNESGLSDTQMDLEAQFPYLQVETVLGLIQDKGVMERAFHRYRPQVVFHAAAYKHVHMLEDHPWQAVFNNIVGTENLLRISAENGIERFVFVSTDKAVRPTNVMGASKRVGERLVQLYAKKYNGRFMAVRFGNVVGSVGSVVPIFQRQIRRGGPVTVRHSEVTRYFMSIREASRLILQAGALGKGGEIFILKMGKPVRILDMARDLIRLSGLEPGEDIEIVETGLLPGEKLHEELITEGEGIEETEHEEIMVLRGDNNLSMEGMKGHLQRLVKLAEDGDAEGIKMGLKEIVPEYTPARQGEN